MDISSDSIPILKKNHVHMNNKKSVEEKLLALVEGEKRNLQIVADFDFTLTKFHVKGKKAPSTYGVVESYSRWPTRFKEDIKLLKIQYDRIDSDPSKTVEEKLPILMNLLKNAFKILSESKLTKKDFSDMVEESSIQLRDGVVDFFIDLNTAKIPTLILSAGLRNVILQILENNGLLNDNVKIRANHLDCKLLNGVENISDHEVELVHPYNKDVISMSLSNSYFSDLSQRRNVILLGDSLEDLLMSKGIFHSGIVLTIGYLNSQENRSLKEFKDRYDIVIVDDQTMDIPHAIVKLAIGKNK